MGESEDIESSVLIGENLKFNFFNRGLAIACLNINSLTAHIDELRVFMRDSKIDILAINESKLDITINDHEVYIPGYETVRRDRLMVVQVVGFASTYVVTLILKCARSL